MSGSKPTDSARNSLWAIIRLGLWLVFWIIVIGWLVRPAEPSRFFRLACYSGIGSLLAVVMIRPARQALLRQRKARHLLDVISVNALLIVVLAEGLVLLLAASTNSPLFAFHDADAAARLRRFRYPAGGAHNGRRCNQLGMVDDEFSVQRQPGSRRIVALGDSFAVSAVTYEDNFLTVLDDILDTPTGDVEVLNFGVSNCGLPEYLHLWRTEASEFQPDLVLLCFFIGNDFVSKPHRRSSFLHADSVRFLTVIKRLMRMQSAQGVHRSTETPDPDAPSLPEDVFNKLVRKRLEICRKANEAELAQRFDPTLKLLAKVQDEIGDRLRIAIIPSEFQVSSRLFRSLAQDSVPSFDLRLPNRRLAQGLTRLNIPFLDLTPAIQDGERVASTYKPRDTHWNARGNRIAAQALSLWLKDQLR